MRWLVLVFSLAASAFAGAHRLDGSNYSGHDAGLCGYANNSLGGSVSCSDPAANPCDSGRSTSAHTPNSRGHSHAGFPANKEQTQACQDYLARLNPPPVVDPPPPPACEHGDACDGYGEHDPTDHDCESCDDQNGTCGYHLGHRHPGQCPNIIVDPPPPAESCECCEGVQVTKGDGETCEQTCGSLLRQQPQACPVDDDDDPPVDPPPPPAIDPEVDQPGCFDNPPHPYHNGCPGPNVLPGHDCASADYHSHSDAFNGECHSDEFEHGVIGCGRDMHQHGDYECHNEAVTHITCQHGEACDSWGEHEEVEHDCTVCDDRDGTCGWLDGHRHPNQCANDPDWVPPDDTPVDPPVDPVDPPVDPTDDEPITPPPPECPVCPVCPYRPPCPDCPPPVTEYVEFCPVKPPQWGSDTW